MKRPDLAVPAGLLIGLLAICIGAWVEGVRLSFLWQPTAALIVVGGTVGAILIRRGFRGLKIVLRELLHLCFQENHEELDAAKARLTWLARLARRDGVQAFESQATAATDPLFSQALMMASQYAPPAVIREKLQRVLDFEEECGIREVATLEGAASYAPTFGILGAILGLIQVLRALADPSSLGVGIATAFVATIYGVGLANLVLFPLAARLRERHLNYMRRRTAIAEALVALASHESPAAISMTFANELEMVSQKAMIG